MSTSVVQTAAPELDAFKLRSPLGPAPPFGKDVPVCVVQYEDWVYVGLESGTICAYMIEARRPNKREEERKWGEVPKKRVGRSAIRQMCIIDPQSSFHQAWLEQQAASGKAVGGEVPEQPLLFVLVDGRILALHAYTLTLAVDFAAIQNVSLFTVDLLPPHHLILHVKTKRKLHVVSYTVDALNPSKSKHDVVKDIAILDTPLAIAAQGDSCVVAYRKQYVLLSVSGGGEGKELPVPLDTDKIAPCIHLMSPVELLLMTNSNLGLFIDFKSRPLPRNPLDWGGHSPFTVAQVDHYVVGLFTETPYEVPSDDKDKKSAPTAVAEAKPASPPASAQFTSIRIASLLDNRIVQTIPIPNPNTCTSSRDKCILLTSDGYLFTLYVVSLEEQIAQYMELSRTEEALALLQRTAPDTVRVLEFHVEAGFVMLKDLQLVQAFTHFVQSNVDPRELIVLFPSLVLPERGAWQRKHDVGVIDELIEKGRRKAEQRSEDKRYRAVLSLSSLQLQRQAKLLLAQFLWDRRERGKLWDDDDIPWVDTVLLMLCVEFMDDDAVQSPTAGSTTAIVAAKAKPGAPTVTLSTAVFSFRLEALLLPSNQIIQSEAETFLLVKHRYNALASYYLSVQQQRKALEVYHRLGSGEFSETDKATGQPDNGVRQTLALLLALGDDELLWEFAEWILLRDKEAGLSVFTSRDRRVALPTEKVLAYLKRVNAKRAAAAKGAEGGEAAVEGPDIVESYLEHIVMHGIVKDTLYHTQLALTYLRKIHTLQQQQAAANNSSTTAVAAEAEEKQQLEMGKKKKKKKGAVANHLVSLHRPKPGTEAAPLGPLRRKLYRFLQQQPSYYDTRSVLSALLSWVWPMEERERRKGGGEEEGVEAAEDVMDGLWLPPPDVIARTELPLVEEMILLLARLELDEKVLRLFIYALRDHTGAAQYCLQVTKQRMRRQQQELYERIVRESKETREKRLLDDEAALLNRTSTAPQRKNSARRRESVAEEEEDDISDDEDVMDEDVTEEQLRARQKKRRLRAQREQLRQQREERDRLEREEEERRLKAAEEAEQTAATLSAQQQPLGEDESPHPGDVFLELVGLYFSDAFYHDFATQDEKRAVEERGEGFIPPTAYQYAVDVITLYHPYINVVRAVARMPAFVPLSALAPLFTRLLPRTLHTRQHYELLKGLSRSHHLHVEADSIGVRSRGVVVDERRRCAHCDKLLGDAITVGLPVQPSDADWDKGVSTVGNDEWLLGGKSGLAAAFVLVHYQCSHAYSALRTKGKEKSSSGK